MRPLIVPGLALLTLVGCVDVQEDDRAAEESTAQATEGSTAQSADGSVAGTAGTPVVVAPESAVLGDLPFSPGIRAGDFLFLSGAIGTRPGTTELVSDDVGEQTAQTLANLETVLEAGGADLGDVVKCTVFLVDMADYGAMNEAYATVWPGAPPARSTMAGSGLALGAKVEIECIAYVGG